MEMAYVVTVSIIFLSFIDVSKGITFCNKTSACSCMGDNGLVDLSPLASSSGPRFKDFTVFRGNGDKYSWNPCYNFTEGGCKNAAVCVTRNGTNQQMNIGNQNTADFKVFNGALTVTYTSLNAGKVSTSVVALKCDPIREGNFIVLGEVSPSFYEMSLNSKYACMGGRGDTFIPLSLNSLLTIVFTYLVL